jgi:hypothetical protein
MTPDEAAGWYGSSFGETVNMADFLATPGDRGFVRTPGEPAAEPPRAGHRAELREPAAVGTPAGQGAS